MRRREFIALVGAALTMAPSAAFAQLGHLRLVGLLLSQFEGNQEANDRIGAIRNGLQKLGWTEGRNIRIEVRYANGSAEQMRAQAVALVQLSPDVLIASATSALGALQKATSTIPIVFAQVTDPVGAGFVKSLARPGGNITGFTQHEFSIGVKWMELLKELAPQTEHMVLIYDPQNSATTGYRSAIKAGVQPFQLQLSEYPVRDAVEIERAVGAAAGRTEQWTRHTAGACSISSYRPGRRAGEQASASRRLSICYWVAKGGLAFYGIDNIELHRQAATYVDRILKGEKPGDLPIQNATKFELVINLKTAKALGINPPNSLLARTDEVIE